MKTIKFISALFLLLAGMVLPMNASENSGSLAVQGDYLENTGDSVWKMGDALLTNSSQITTNNYEPGFPASNLLRPESEGVGTNQIIWHGMPYNEQGKGKNDNHFYASVHVGPDAYFED